VNKNLAVAALVAASSSALTSPSLAAGPIWSEGINGDLPNSPVGSPILPATPGVTWAVQGIIGTNFVDVDFVTIVVPFATNRLLLDVDTNTIHQDSVMGVANINQYPSNPALINDDDLDIPDDALAGHNFIPLDSMVDVTAVLGSPLPANSIFTVAIGRTGEQFLNWNGTSHLDRKLEYKLWVYTEIVPAPGAIGLGLAGLCLAARRRRR
jgi:hypothetical protein